MQSDRTAKLICIKILRKLPNRRVVLSGLWDQINVVAKIFFHPQKKRRDCARETKGLLLLKTTPIKTATLLQHLQTACAQSEILIYEQLQPAISVKELFATLNEEHKSVLLKKIVQILVQLHQAGLEHTDPHLSNFLVHQDEIVLLDYAAIKQHRHGKALSRRKSLDHLAFFLAQFRTESPQWSKLITDHYDQLRKIKFTAKELIYFNRLVNHKIAHMQKKVLAKIFRETSTFAQIKCKNKIGNWAKAYASPEFSQFIANLDHYLENNSILLERTQTTKVGIISIAQKNFLLKKYQPRTLIHALKARLNRSPAYYAWLRAHQLQFLGQATAQPVAWLQHHQGLFKSCSYYLAEYDP